MNAATNPMTNNDMELKLRHCVEQYGECHPITSKLYNKMGNVHFRKGDFEMAERYYEKASLCESERHIACLNLGTVHWRTGNLDTAISFLKSAKRSTKDADAKASVYHQLGLCYALAQDSVKALRALTKACDIRMQCHGASHISVAKTMHAMANVHTMVGDYDAAIQYCKTALDRMQHNDTSAMMTSLSHLAAVYRAAGRSREETETLQELHRLAASSDMCALRGDVSS